MLILVFLLVFPSLFVSKSVLRTLYSVRRTETEDNFPFRRGMMNYDYSFSPPTLTWPDLTPGSRDTLSSDMRLAFLHTVPCAHRVASISVSLRPCVSLHVHVALPSDRLISRIAYVWTYCSSLAFHILLGPRMHPEATGIGVVIYPLARRGKRHGKKGEFPDEREGERDAGHVRWNMRTHGLPWFLVDCLPYSSGPDGVRRTCLRIRVCRLLCAHRRTVPPGLQTRARGGLE